MNIFQAAWWNFHRQSGRNRAGYVVLVSVTLIAALINVTGGTIALFQGKPLGWLSLGIAAYLLWYLALSVRRTERELDRRSRRKSWTDA